MVNAINAKQFRESLRKPGPSTGLPLGPYNIELPRVRVVPAFTVQALQKNTKVIPPQRNNFYEYKTPAPSEFRRSYLGLDLPITIDVVGGNPTLRWKKKIDTLDFHQFLPIFFDGLTEVERPYSFLAEQGIHDMLQHGSHKVLPVVPQLIIPIKNALNTKHPLVICATLRVLQHLAISADLVGEALVPYYRQILPVLNMFCLKNKNLWDGIDYSQQKRENVGDIVQETLEILERYGGEDAFINIKYMVPTYESCMVN